MTIPPSPTDDLREQFAAVEHERWAHWQLWMHGCCRRNEDGSLTIPAHLVARWERQAATPYEDLSDPEKDADREQVDRYWHLLLIDGGDAYDNYLSERYDSLHEPEHIDSQPWGTTQA